MTTCIDIDVVREQSFRNFLKMFQGDFDRENLTVEELGHYLNHNLVNGMAHNKLLTKEIMRQIKESIRDGSYIGKGPK